MKKPWAALATLLVLMLGTTLSADDTDVFSGTTINVPPNVLIIFDSSGTMNDPINSNPYDPATNYASLLTAMGRGQFAVTENIVYYISGYTGGGHENPVYSTFPPPATKKSPMPTPLDWSSGTYCSSAKTALSSNGWWMGNVDILDSTICSGVNYKLYTGRYINYLTYQKYSGAAASSPAKIDILRNVMDTILGSIQDGTVRFGLMMFNRTQQGQGGEVIAPVGSTDDYVMSQIDAEIMARKSQLVSDTPLAECLAEAGLYYAGRQPWSSNLDQPDYVSPVQYWCQKNYVIILTDGQPTSDQGVNNRSQDIFNNRDTKTGVALSQYFGKVIGNYDGEDDDVTADAYGGTHMLDDVAKFLYEGDILLGESDSNGHPFGESDPAQSIRTFAVGFDAATDFTYLNKVVDRNHGRGGNSLDQAYTARNATELTTALQATLAAILEANSSFIAPVVPVNKINKVYSGNSVYLSLFKPDATDPFWIGNLKKFGIDSYGVLRDRFGNNAADANGQILATATSCWQKFSEDSGADASETDKGGAGRVLLHQSTRHFYTNTNNACPTSLAQTGNLFSIANTDLISRIGAATTEEAEDLVHYLTASGKYAFGTALTGREWVLGDLLHSKPATMFDGNRTVIFVGSNDGFLQTFLDNDNETVDNLNDDTMSEAWCFTPWEVVPNLKNLQGAGGHSYFVDGSPTIYDDGGHRYVAFGLRRGGSGYYGINVGSLDTNGNYITNGYTAPSLSWSVDSSTGVGETLGQSWGKPNINVIRLSPTLIDRVVILPGGYDNANQDLTTPAANDSKGRAVFAVDAATGDLVSTLNFNKGNYAAMNHSIVELAAFDYDTDSYTDTVYAGDLGGDIFAFNDRDRDGDWDESKMRLFSARSASAGTQNMLLKFFYEPDIVLEKFGDFVFIGTGDREHPNDTNTVNRFYAIKNTWTSASANLTEGDLEDVTGYNYTAATLTNLETGKGWFIRFNLRAGEKVESSPLLYNGIVFFTTFVPDTTGSTSSDPCNVPIGGGRLYALDYITGKAAMNFNTANDTNGIVKDDSDRSTPLGVGIPSPPTLIVTKDGGAMLIIGTSGPAGTTGAQTIAIPSTGKARMYYWKQR